MSWDHGFLRLSTSVCACCEVFQYRKFELENFEYSKIFGESNSSETRKFEKFENPKIRLFDFSIFRNSTMQFFQFLSKASNLALSCNKKTRSFPKNPYTFRYLLRRSIHSVPG